MHVLASCSRRCFFICLGGSNTHDFSGASPVLALNTFIFGCYYVLNSHASVLPLCRKCPISVLMCLLCTGAQARDLQPPGELAGRRAAARQPQHDHHAHRQQERPDSALPYNFAACECTCAQQACCLVLQWCIEPVHGRNALCWPFVFYWHE